MATMIEISNGRDTRRKLIIGGSVLAVALVLGIPISGKTEKEYPTLPQITPPQTPLSFSLDKQPEIADERPIVREEDCFQKEEKQRVENEFQVQLIDTNKARWSRKEIDAVSSVLSKFPPEAVKGKKFIRESYVGVRELTSENTIRISLPPNTLLLASPDLTLSQLWEKLDKREMAANLRKRFNNEVWKLEWLIAHGLVHSMTNGKRSEQENLSEFRKKALELGIFWILPGEETPTNLEKIKQISQEQHQEILEINSILLTGKILLTGRLPTTYSRLHPNEALADFGAFWYLSSQPKAKSDYGFFTIPVSFYQSLDLEWRNSS